MSSTKGAAKLAKRLFDLVGAGVALLLLSPLLLGTAIAVARVHGRPVLFRQRRPGLHGAPFTILKFRTMRPLRPGEPPYLSDEARLTPLGRFLRRTSLDELPELLNVLRGDMSLVGPRPLLVEYLDKYTPEERRRHDVLPGITGWAAVNGRHTLRFADRLKLDVWYVDHWSFGLDLRILARTVAQVVRREDVTESQSIAEIGFPIDAPRGDAAGGAPPLGPGAAAAHGGGAGPGGASGASAARGPR